MVDGDGAEKITRGVADYTEQVKQALDDAKPTGDDADANGSGPPWFKIGLAMLGPTIALFGIMAGVWFDAQSADRAREDEAKARVREEIIRRNELAVPIYKDVATAQAEVDYLIVKCENAVSTWFNTPPSSPEEAEAEEDIEAVCVESVDREVSTLEARLNQALLVSDENLADPAREYLEALQAWKADFERYRDIKGDLAYEEAFDLCFDIEDEVEFEQCLDDNIASEGDGGENAAALANRLEATRRALEQAVRDQVLDPVLSEGLGAPTG